MARKSKSEIESSAHERLLREFDVVAGATKGERDQCLMDRRFINVAGAQWEGPLAQQYANKPKFEVNKVAKSCRRIYNDMRNHRIDVVMNPKGDDVDGRKRKLADTTVGLYRADRIDSNASEAEDAAFDEAVAGGIGAYRLCTEYVDDDNDDDERQRIRWEPIFDADSCVYFDLGAKRADKRDASRCWVLHPMTWDAYRETYDDDPASWPKPVTQTWFDWQSVDAIVVAEVYEIEKKRRTVHVFELLDGTEERYDDDELKEIDDASGMTMADLVAARGGVEVRTKKSTKRRVRKWVMNGARILEDCGYIVGPNIPVVMIFGQRSVIDGIERAFGHTRMVKDSQRLKNMAMSKIAEIASVSSTRKPIFLPEQVQGHEAIWRDANIEERAYMTINPVVGPDGANQPAGPVGFTEQPDIPPALAALVQTSDVDINDLLGNQGGGDQLLSNTSGRTVEAIQERLDEQTYLYVNNFAQGSRRAAEIWLGMAREIYDEDGREMRSMSSEGDASTVTLGKMTATPEGERYRENDLADADFDVDIEIGPTSSSKRKSVVNQALALLSAVQDPATQEVLTSFIMMNLEGEGVSDLNAFARQKLIRLGVVQPTEEEQAQLAQEAQAKSQQPPDPQAQLMRAAAMEAEAKAQKAKAEVLETFAETELKRAQTMRTKAEIPGVVREGVMPLHMAFGRRS